MGYEADPSSIPGSVCRNHRQIDAWRRKAPGKTHNWPAGRRGPGARP